MVIVMRLSQCHAEISGRQHGENECLEECHQEFERHRIDEKIDLRTLQEIYFPAFRAAVQEGGAWSVMSAYNSVNGEWAGQHHGLLTEVLRDEWGFEGFVISDWIFGMRDAATSVTAGLDIEMPYRMIRASHLRDSATLAQLGQRIACERRASR